MTPDATYLDFPMAIDARGRTATTDAENHVRDLIFQVLFTNPGERVNRPEFGCGLRQLVFAPASDALATATEQLVHGSLIRWLDPLIQVERVAVAIRDAELQVTVVYRRRETGESREEVFRHSASA